MTATALTAAVSPADLDPRPRGLRTYLWGTALLWRREMVRLRHNPISLIMGLLTPLLFLVVLGTGLDAASGLGRASRSAGEMAAVRPVAVIGCPPLWSPGPCR